MWKIGIVSVVGVDVVVVVFGPREKSRIGIKKRHAMRGPGETTVMIKHGITLWKYGFHVFTAGQISIPFPSSSKQGPRWGVPSQPPNWVPRRPGPARLQIHADVLGPGE